MTRRHQETRITNSLTRDETDARTGAVDVDGADTWAPRPSAGDTRDMPSAPHDHAVVSILIVSYDCKHALLECLASLEGEHDTRPTEVIVIDNDSHDDTARAVSSRFPW
ncbi:MAG: glycosyltransferase family 2 protein, partial [Gaiellaceae bacterium]